MKSILNPAFKYTSAARTDIRKLFARVRKQLQADAQERTAKVEPLKKRAA